MNLAMGRKTGMLKRNYIFEKFTIRMSRCRSCLQAQSQLSHHLGHSRPRSSCHQSKRQAHAY